MDNFDDYFVYQNIVISLFLFSKTPGCPAGAGAIEGRDGIASASAICWVDMISRDYEQNEFDSKYTRPGKHTKSHWKWSI